jgi:hypothetical protein
LTDSPKIWKSAFADLLIFDLCKRALARAKKQGLGKQFILPTFPGEKGCFTEKGVVSTMYDKRKTIFFV